MRQFDLEAAKRGEPIEFMKAAGNEEGRVWKMAHFVGTDRAGDIVIENSVGRFERVYSSELRMKPRKRTVFVNFYPMQPGARAAVCMAYDTAIDAQATSGANAIAVAHPVEIEE